MSITKPLDKYNFEDLFLYCELTTGSELGNLVDFTGIKTYNIGFLKEGVGFGITNISVDITPSMQPVIEVTFKDFYGNAAIEFNRNSGLLNKLTDETNQINYASLFELPYPKFKLVLKGYIGKPVSLDLNVKRIDVSYVSSDGSYEIKAIFIPNLYGFFADMPFYFLKSIKYLKYNNENQEGYISLFDVIETGRIVQQNQVVAQKNIEKLKKNLLILQNETDAMWDDDFNWFEESLLDNIDLDGNKIPGYTKLYINVGKFTNKKTQDNNTTLFAPPNYAKRNKGFLRDAESNVNGKVFRQKIISSISTINEHKGNGNGIVYLQGEPLNRSKYASGVELIKQAIKYCDDYEKRQLKQVNRDVIEKLTIKSVFDLLIQDSAYLMGSILQAGMKGYDLDRKKRDDDANKSITGKYFPLISDENTKEQIPYAKSGPEANFVNKFISALSNGLAEEERKKLNEDPIFADENSTNKIIKRITNLEIGSANPYLNSYNSQHIISNIIERTGLMAHYFMSTISVGISVNNGDKDDIIDSEIENVQEGLNKILGGNGADKTDLLNFFEDVNNLIDDDGEFKKDGSGNIFNISSITSKINFSSGIDKNTLTANRLFNNNIHFVADETTNGVDTYILFELNKFKNAASISGSIGTGSDSTNPNGDKDYDYFYVDKKGGGANIFSPIFDFFLGDTDETIDFNIQINNGKVYDFHKLQNGSNLESALVKEPISNSGQYLYAEKKYFFAKYRSGLRNDDLYNINDKPVVWNLTGSTNEANLQRYALKRICKKLKGEVQNAEETIKENTQNIVDNLQNGKGYNILYKQFHTLCNNWKNLVDDNTVVKSENVLEYVLGKFITNGTTSNIFYEFPLQNIQNNTKINVQDSIISIEPLYKNNEQSTVLNVMSNICLKNNFMFLAIPGMAGGNGFDKFITKEPLEGLFEPFTNFIEYGSIESFNHFYVLWMPTPEDRATLNSGTELYLDFNPDDLNLEGNFFQIDYGSPDNTVFKSINMTTEDNKMTSESAIAINSIADSSNSNKYKSFDCSALSVMEGRSYKISVEMIGNAQIKPTQFFVLNSTHIFSGLYQIMKVSHTVRPNDMTTKFEAIKMKYNGQFAGFSYIPPITLRDIYQQEAYYGSENIQQNYGDNLFKEQTKSEQFSVLDVKNNPTQTAELNKLHPKVRDIFKNFVYEVEDKTGYHVLITSGFRTYEEQAVQSKKDDGKNAEAGGSHHNFGMAIDINLTNENGKHLKKASARFQWIATGAVDIALKYGLVWGGNFSSYYDPVHFDAQKLYPIGVLRKAYLAQKQIDNKIQGNEINLA